ncbi:hypothetical protein CDA38_03940 [Klebsiella pneumoniae]|nr:hypothetical protein CDA38_03940 [Klebsiella pneumoniae]
MSGRHLAFRLSDISKPASCRRVDRNVVPTPHQKGTGATEIAHQLRIARPTGYKILEDERAS